ncbi:hypothetical protein [Pectinatus frisingensis]|nr:hypothetical protein [Pectinatus frisingensis]
MKLRPGEIAEDASPDDFDKAYYCINCNNPVIFRIDNIRMCNK